MKLDSLIDNMKKGYDAFDFHIALHALHNFCVIDMSNFYLDIIKDRLYCEKEDSVLRRAAQTAMYRILSAITRLAAPIISFTAEEIWQFMPHGAGDDKESVFLNQMPEKSGIEFTADFTDKWEFIYNTRLGANKALEEARNEKTIGKSLEAKIIIKSSDADYDRYASLADQLRDILIVSGVEVEKSGGETVFEVAKAEGEKCERCWCFSKYVGTNHDHPTLCERCAVAIEP
jgi:isoleucyl-tRNA synthetase